MEQVNLLMLGGGPAGIQATRIVKKARPDWRVTMLRPEPYSMVYCAIPYVLEGVIPPDSALKRDALVTDIGVELVRQTAVDVNLEQRLVRTEDGTEYRFEHLLIGTGARSLVPPLPGADLDRIETVKSQVDMDRILGYLNGKPHRAVVIGAGAIGLEQAIAFHRRGLEVHLVDLADRILPHMADADISEPARVILEEIGIKLHLGTKLESFEGNRAVAAVKLEGGERIELEEGRDFVVMALGMRPNVELFDGQLQMEPDGIVVDDHMRTSAAGIYAAGDCVANISGIDGKLLGGKLATNAVPQAKVAAANILGKEASYPGIFNGVVTVVGDLRIGATGFTETFARSRGFNVVTAKVEFTSRFPMMPGATPVLVKLVAEAESGRLLGGQVRGHEAVAERVDVITLALQQRLSVKDLIQLSYSAQPWQTYFPANNPIVAAASELAG